jgi:translation initiation factor IF-2
LRKKQKKKAKNKTRFLFPNILFTRRKKSLFGFTKIGVIMARLHKVIAELNISVDRAVEFLEKKGFKIEASPNTKITEEQEMLLFQEYSTDKSIKQESERRNQQRQLQEKTEYVAIEGYEDEADKVIEEKKVEPEEIKIEIQRPKIIDKIDLDKKPSKKTKEVKEEVEAKKEEIIDKKDTPTEKVVEEKTTEPEEIKIKIQRPKIVDKIDLDKKPSKKIKEVKEEVEVSPKEEIKKELGDVLWFVSEIATNLGISLEDVAHKNLDKLASRKERGVIHGSGDNR